MNDGRTDIATTIPRRTTAVAEGVKRGWKTFMKRTPRPTRKLLRIRSLMNLLSPPTNLTCFNGEQWTEYFIKLLCRSNIESDSKNWKEALTALKEVPVFNKLNYGIDGEEILKVIKKLKNNKSSGPDGIIYEMIKHGKQALLKPLKVVFNKIFCQVPFL